MRETQPGGSFELEPRIQGFLDELARQDLAASTVRSYGHDLVGFFRWYVEVRGEEQARLEGLTSVDLVRYREHLVDGRKYRGSTVNRRMESLRRLCRWAHRQGILAEDVTEGLRPVRRARRVRPAGLKKPELHGLLREAGRSSHGLRTRNYALVQLLAQTGLRVGEVAALQVADVTVRERVGSVRVRRGKGRKEREIPLNAAARRALRDYLTTREEIREEDHDEAFFLSTRGQGMSIRSVQHTVSSLARRAGIDRLEVSAHTLRHTFALNYLRANPGKLVELATLMGHDSLDTTAIYTRPSMEDLAEDVERSSRDELG